MKIVNPVKNAILAKWPKGQITQGFGENPGRYNQFNLKGHNGVDIIKSDGWPIIGTAGRVVEVRYDPTGLGSHIRILTDPDLKGDYLELSYGHMRGILVSPLQRVKDGEQVGTMGNTGTVASGDKLYVWGNAPAGKGVHLHLTVRECNLSSTGWTTSYSTGLQAYIKNYDNGYKGAVDPFPFLEEGVKEEAVSAIELAKKVIAQFIEYLKGRNRQ